MNRHVTSRCNPAMAAAACLIAILAMPGFALAQHNHADPSGAMMAAAPAGIVSFENSGAPAAQKDFLYGLAQLHNFQYEAAAAAFRRAQQADPDFAMAYWGEAMTHNHAIWAQQDLPAARAVLVKLGRTIEARRARTPTARETAYLNTIEILYGDGDKYDRDRRYALAMERLHATYPDDIDGTCFYALALLGTAHAGRDVPTYMRSAALMQEVFERHPDHPGAAHYLIHSVDDAAHAPLGLRAANAYSKIAPDSPHAQHMTSHIYLALGMWQEMVAANEAASAVTARKIRATDPKRPLPACGHVQIWQAYGYLQQGRFNNARRLVEACGEEMQNLPTRMDGADLLSAEGSSAAAFQEMRTRHLIDSGEWTGSLARGNGRAAELPFAEFSRSFADTYGDLRFGKGKIDVDAVNRTQQAAKQLIAEVVQAGIPAGHPQRLVPMIEVDQLRGLVLLRQGDADRAIELLEKAAAAERALPMDFGPPSLHKPANELLGEVLLELGRAKPARLAFENAQIVAPGRTKSLAGLAQCAKALGDTELADSVNAKLQQIKVSAAADSE